MLYAVKGRETIASVATAKGLTAAKLTSTVHYALVQAIGGPVRFTIDGATPPVAGTTGFRLVQDGTVELWGEEMSKFSAIDDGGTASLEVSYHGQGGKD
jgi:hypothetical protein